MREQASDWADHLMAGDDLGTDQRAAVEAMVAEHAGQHGCDTEGRCCILDRLILPRVVFLPELRGGLVGKYPFFGSSLKLRRSSLGSARRNSMFFAFGGSVRLASVLQSARGRRSVSSGQPSSFREVRGIPRTAERSVTFVPPM